MVDYSKELKGKPEDAGMSKERLRRIQSFIEQYIERNEIAGAVSLIARNGQITYFDALGHRDFENKKPMTKDTIFRIASMTKPIASVALMILYEEGHFLLSDLISKWIPEYKDTKVIHTTKPPIKIETKPSKRQINIRHLLTHTSGLSYSPPPNMIPKEWSHVVDKQKPDETIGEFSRKYALVPLKFNPGENWEYSRATDVIGHLVEIVSGIPLDKYLRKNIFEPLKMHDTYFYLPRDKLDRLAVCYKPDSNNKIIVSDPASEESLFVKEPHTYFRGAGGLVSTASDYYRFYQMLLNGGELDGVRILSRKTVELMTQNHIGDLCNHILGPGFGFGLGFGIAMNSDHINTLTRDLKWLGLPWSEGSYSWGGAYCTMAWADPKENIIGVFMTQLNPNDHVSLRSEFVRTVYQALID